MGEQALKGLISLFEGDDDQGNSKEPARGLDITKDETFLSAVGPDATFYSALGENAFLSPHSSNGNLRANDVCGDVFWNSSIERPRDCSVVHDGDTSSSEDEYQRHHDDTQVLSASGRKLKQKIDEGRKSGFSKKQLVPSESVSIPQSDSATIHSKNEEDRSMKQKAELGARVKAAAVLSSTNDASIYDAAFGVRVRNPKVSSVVFESYCDGMKKLRISSLLPKSAPVGNWITMGVVVDKSEVRKSANGNEYIVWRLSDLLDLHCQPVKVLLFGDSVTEHWKVQVATVVALTSSAYCGDENQVTLKISKGTQVFLIGVSPDFGYCKANKKDKERCRNFVNLSRSEYCFYHIEAAARILSARRGAFGSVSVYPPLKRVLKDSSNSTMATYQRFTKPLPKLLTLEDVRSGSKGIHAAQKPTMPAEVPSVNIHSGRDVNTQVRNLGTQNLMLAARMPEQAKQKKEDITLHSKAKSFKEFIENQILKTESQNITVSVGTLRGERDANDAKNAAVAKIRAMGGIVKANPNVIGGRKRRMCNDDEKDGVLKPDSSIISHPSVLGDQTANKKMKFTDEELREILNKKGSHESELHQEDMKRECAYFNAMEQREKVESFVTSIREVPNCDVFTCCKCDYTSHKRSNYCIANGHSVTSHKATKRFFRCRSCLLRSICYTLLPTKPCKNCNGNDFERVAMRDERKVTLPNEQLQLRGEERKFINS